MTTIASIAAVLFILVGVICLSVFVYRKCQSNKLKQQRLREQQELYALRVQQGIMERMQAAVETAQKNTPVTRHASRRKRRVDDSDSINPYATPFYTHDVYDGGSNRSSSSSNCSSSNDGGSYDSGSSDSGGGGGCD